MASETTPAPVNGNYAPHQNVAEATFPAHTTGSNPPSYTTAQSSSSAQPSSGKGASDIPQDEVGWYFVEQYYTTLSRSPEKLFLFYNKRSQFVSGVEEEKVSVCIGQKAINERIKELDFQDCKVRITNVDSQGSEDHIVIQVIGEISNKHAPHRKFCQTFILAGQTNGYFVLNDIFRYILDEEPELEGEEVQPEPEAPSGYHEPVPTASNAEPKGLTPADDQAAQEADAAKVDKELEEVIKADKASTAIAVPAVPREVNGTPVPEAAEAEEAEDAPAAAVSAPEEAPAAAEPAEEVKEPEKPKEADSKKAAPIPKASPAPPAAPTGPPKVAAPKTWASLAASANRVAMPAVPSAAQSSTASQPKPAPAAPAQAAAPVTAAAAAPAAQTSQHPPREPSPANSGSEGWQTAGHDHSKRQSRTQGQAATGENNSTRAYIKNVYESVDGDVLKKELAKFGEIVYFDISRQKNCAFVDFATLAGFQAAVNANPHTIGENQIYVEERRLRPSGSFPFQRGGGGMPRGRGDRPVGQGRGGFKPEGTRGNFSSRGRGGATTPRGRGSGQAA